MMKRRSVAAFAMTGALALASCAPTEAPGEQFVSKAPAAVAAGAPVSCVQVTLIRETKVWDDRTIDFVMSGGARYRNTLPYSCPGLGFEQRFAHKTSTTSLCNVDTITVLPTGSSIPGPTCALGPFVPVELAGG